MDKAGGCWITPKRAAGEINQPTYWAQMTLEQHRFGLNGDFFH